MNTDLFVFCYDHNNHYTFLNMKKYYDEVSDFLSMDVATKRDTVKILMACQYGEDRAKSTLAFKGNFLKEGDKLTIRTVNENDKAALKKQGVYFDMEFTCSTLLAKENFNVQATMDKKVLKRMIDTQEKRKQYRKKKS